MTWSWAELPTDRVVRLIGANADVLSLSIDPLPDDAPVIVTYVAGESCSAVEMVAEVLCELEMAAVGLFPAWLPGAEGIDAPGGAGVSAVRALALRAASVTDHFGPFLADLAELSLESAREGGSRRSVRFGPEVRAAGLARVLAASFDRRHASILLQVPEGLPASAEEVLVAGCEWLAHRGELGVWLTGAPLVVVDRVEPMAVRLPAELAGLALGVPSSPEAPATRAIGYPAVAGMPHPASRAEKVLETALASCDWAAGRAWNQTYRSHSLANPIRVDLLWRNERCVVEVDGPEHRTPLIFAADRRRDVQLQLDGFAVLRFTNSHVMTDTETVVRQMERLLQSRRLGTLEG